MDTATRHLADALRALLAATDPLVNAGHDDDALYEARADARAALDQLPTTS